MPIIAPAALLIGMVDWRRLWAAPILIVVCMAGVSWSELHQRIKPFVAAGQAGLFGLQDTSLLLPAEVAELEKSDAKLILVGEAQAFLFQMPMTRLRYRTVLDVGASGGPDIVQSWIGGESVAGNCMLVINVDELRRFSSPLTGYWGIAPPPADLIDMGPIVIRPCR
jgi:hypothetical protein